MTTLAQHLADAGPRRRLGAAVNEPAMMVVRQLERAVAGGAALLRVAPDAIAWEGGPGADGAGGFQSPRWEAGRAFDLLLEHDPVVRAGLELVESDARERVYRFTS